MFGIEEYAKKSEEFAETKIKESSEMSELPESIEDGHKMEIEPPDMSLIERMSRAWLIEQCSMKTSENKNKEKTEQTEGGETKQEGLTEEEKAKIKEETGWSDEIINAIENMKQYEIYKNAGLHECEINGRKCLVKDIDYDYVDPKTGMTNRELMEKGRPPIDSKTGERIELHHMGQKPDAPFAELCENSEHGDGNHKVLHTSNSESWRNDADLNNKYNNQERPEHWKERAKEG